VCKLARDTLAHSSKDLYVAARLTEALTRLHRFTGLRDGLRLLRGLVEQYWEDVYPLMEDGDLDYRIGPFNWLDDAGGGALFPSTVHLLPLIPGANGSLSWQDWRNLADGIPGPVSAVDFDRGVHSASREACVQVAAEIDQCLEEIDRLSQTLLDRMGQQKTPGLYMLRQAVADCQDLMQQVLAKKPEERPPGDQDSDSTMEGMTPGADGSEASTSQARSMSSRKEAYDQLARIAQVLEQLDPHSPVPRLVKRAVELGRMSYEEMMADLIRDPTVLAEFYRELGIKRTSEQQDVQQ
jgi:type VI secretion system protein ImpA